MNKLKIDSLKIRIPVNLIKLKNDQLFDKWGKINLSSGLIIENKKEEPIRFRSEMPGGFSYEMVIRRHYIRGVSNYYLNIILNSKMVQENYFHGLTLNNIEKVYDDIMSLGWVHFDFNTMLHKSISTDIDFCLDYTATKEDYNHQLTYLKELTPPSQKRDRGYKIHDRGVEWNTRKGATISNPFVKIYDKEFELTTRSNDFRLAYLLEEDITDIRRIEFTIKDASHLQDVGVLATSLSTLLSLDTGQKQYMMQRTMNKIFKYDKKVLRGSVKKVTLEPSRALILESLRFMIDHNYTLQDAGNYLTKTMNTTNKSKYRAKLDTLYRLYIKDLEKDSKTIEAERILNLLRIYK